MTYKGDLQLAYSGREIALQRIKIIDSTNFTDQAERNYSKERRIKYQRLLEKSDERIAEIKSRITEEIAVKKLQLEEYKTEHSHVSTHYKLGEIPLQECEKQQNVLQKQYDQVKLEAVELDKLLETSRSSDVGGPIPVDIDEEVDNYGNINRKKASLNIPSDLKNFNFDTFSNVNSPTGSSIQGLSFIGGYLEKLRNLSNPVEFDVHSGTVSNFRTQTRVSGGGGSINSLGGGVSGSIKDIITTTTATFKVNNVPLQWEEDPGSGIGNGDYINAVCVKNSLHVVALHNASTGMIYYPTISVLWLIIPFSFIFLFFGLAFVGMLVLSLSIPTGYELGVRVVFYLITLVPLIGCVASVGFVLSMLKGRKVAQRAEEMVRNFQRNQN